MLDHDTWNFAHLIRWNQRFEENFRRAGPTRRGRVRLRQIVAQLADLTFCLRLRRELLTCFASLHRSRDANIFLDLFFILDISIISSIEQICLNKFARGKSLFCHLPDLDEWRRDFRWYLFISRNWSLIRSNWSFFFSRLTERNLHRDRSDCGENPREKREERRERHSVLRRRAMCGNAGPFLFSLCSRDDVLCSRYANMTRRNETREDESKE